jgi:hypothetical protein
MLTLSVSGVCWAGMGRPRKALISWYELLAWLQAEGVTEYDLKRRLVGEAAPSWRYPRLLPGRKRRRLYVVREVAVWLAGWKRPEPLAGRGEKGYFLCKN